jgi:UrcA family protein
MKTSTGSTGLRGLIAAAVFGALASSFSAVSSPVRAGDGAQSITVTYQDLDLDAAQGANVLYGRIHQAAESACAYLDHGDVLSLQHLRSCINGAVARAVSEVNSSALRAVYDAKNGTTMPSTATVAR